jgi:hypothetical protein
MLITSQDSEVLRNNMYGLHQYSAKFLRLKMFWNTKIKTVQPKVQRKGTDSIICK